MDPANPHGLQVPTLHKMWWKMWMDQIFQKVEFMCCWRLIWHSFVCFLFFFGLGALLFSVSILYLQLFVTLERLTSAALVPLEMKRCDNSSSVRTHLCQFLYSQHICCLWFMYPLHCCALIPFNKMCINSSMWGSYLGGCPLCPGLLGVKRGCIAFPMDGKYMESLCPSSLGENTVDLIWPEGAKKILKKNWGNIMEIVLECNFQLKLFTLLHWGRDRMWHFFDETSRGSIRGRGSDSFWMNVFNLCART